METVEVLWFAKFKGSFTSPDWLLGESVSFLQALLVKLSKNYEKNIFHSRLWKERRAWCVHKREQLHSMDSVNNTAGLQK